MYTVNYLQNNHETGSNSIEKTMILILILFKIF